MPQTAKILSGIFLTKGNVLIFLNIIYPHKDLQEIS